MSSSGSIIYEKVAIRGSAETRTHCPFCAFQCGVVMQMASSDLVSIAPDADFPVNQGRMCIKGFSAAELLTSTDRITSPLKRKPDGGFARVSWDEALDDIAARILALQSEY